MLAARAGRRFANRRRVPRGADANAASLRVALIACRAWQLSLHLHYHHFPLALQFALQEAAAGLRRSTEEACRASRHNRASSVLE